MYYGTNPETGESETKGHKFNEYDEESLAPGGTRSNLADLQDLKWETSFNALEPKLGDFDAYDEAGDHVYGDDEGYLRPMGYEAEGIPAEGRPLTEADALRSRMARRPGQPYDRSGLPDPEYRGNMEEGKMETLPGADGEEPTRGSNRPTVSQLLNRLNSVQQTGPPIRRDGPRAKFGMKVGTPKQQKIDRLRKFMKNRYR